MAGTLFFVVGPSGIGKDTLLRGAKEALHGDSEFVFARRTITRAPDLGDEGHLSITSEEFTRISENGGFLVSWQAHGLGYGIPIELADDLCSGRNVVVNGSRAAAPDLLAKMKNVVVVEISAPPELIARRLAERGRENANDVKARLDRITPPLPAGTKSVQICNDSDVASGVEKLVSALTSRDIHQSWQAGSKAVRSTEGERALLAKEEGQELSEAQYHSLISEFVEGKYSNADITRFLVAATRSLSVAEVCSLARVRAGFARKISWDEPIVVDKHSVGGIPGSRITMIVVPIVAAHGLAMPKTSSRAITSAAGTADAMETFARVDLDIDAVKRVVSVARGCIAWNGRLNHSALDDVMNAITRPLKLDSTRWSVASILSKKLSAGVTNLIVDLPYGKYAKVKSKQEADELARLFQEVGRQLGLTVEAIATSGREPIGRGIGPALEARDVMEVLQGRPSAPKDLRKKALEFATRVLTWAPDIPDAVAANSRAEQLLDSGAAELAFERIVEMQGRRVPATTVGPLIAKVVAKRSGTITEINGWKVAGIARSAGAPGDPGAGLELFARLGDAVNAGDVLYAIRSAAQIALETATTEAMSESGFDIQ